MVADSSGRGKAAPPRNSRHTQILACARMWVCSVILRSTSTDPRIGYQISHRGGRTSSAWASRFLHWQCNYLLACSATRLRDNVWFCYCLSCLALRIDGRTIAARAPAVRGHCTVPLRLGLCTSISWSRRARSLSLLAPAAPWHHALSHTDRSNKKDKGEKYLQARGVDVQQDTSHVAAT